MGIKKQEFYEGAALHMLARGAGALALTYDAPFFRVNAKLLVYLKYSTKIRSPWGFTFTGEEQALLHEKTSDDAVIVGLICGSDGVAALPLDDFRTIAAPRKVAVHVSCYRLHGEHYEVNGPDGQLQGKIPPGNWHKLVIP